MSKSGEGGCIVKNLDQPGIGKKKKGVGPRTKKKLREKQAKLIEERNNPDK